MGAYLSPGAHGPHPQYDQLHDGRLQDPGALRDVSHAAHEHDADRRLSRRGTAGHRVRRRAPRQPGRGGNRHRPGGAAPAQLHSADRISRTTSPTGGDYEIADLPGVLEKALKLADWKGFDSAAREIEGSREAARHRHLDRHREHRRSATRPQDEVEIAARRERHGHRVTRSPSRRATATRPRSRRSSRTRWQIPLEKVKIVQCAPGHEAQGQPHRRLAQHGRRGQRVPPRGAEARSKKARRWRRSSCTSSLRRSRTRTASSSPIESERIVKLADLAKTKPLSVMADGKFGSTYPNGCHIAEVEVDPETGVTEIVVVLRGGRLGVVINHADRRRASCTAAWCRARDRSSASTSSTTRRPDSR